MQRRVSDSRPGRKQPGGQAGGRRSDRPATPASVDSAWRIGLFLAAVLALKIVVLWQLRDHPLLQPDAGLDAAANEQLARRVLGGDLALGPGQYFMSPLYIYFLAGGLALNDSFTFVRLCQVVLGTAGVYAIFAATRVWFTVRAAWIAAGLAACTGLLTFHEIVLFQGSLDVCLVATALALFALALTTHSRRWSALAGVVWALASLNRPNVGIAVLGVVAVLLVARRLRVAAWLAVGLAIGFAPILARNVFVAHVWSITSSQGGLNFYIGNNAAATGQYVEVPGVRADIEGQSEDTRRVAEAATGRALSDAEVSSHFYGLAWTWIRQHPSAAARLFARKVMLVLNAQHQWLDFSYPFYARDVDSWLRVLVIGPWLLVPLGLAGLIAGGPGKRGDYLIWASFVPTYVIAVAVFFVAERYRTPLFVPLCVGAGAAVDRIVQAISEQRMRSLVLPGIVAAGAAVVTFWPFHLSDGRNDERFRLAKVLMNHRQYDEAAVEFTRLREGDPANTEIEFRLGVALSAAGRNAEGIAHLQHAVDTGVPIDGARYVLARAMQAAGDRAGAMRVLRSAGPAASENAESCHQVALLAFDLGAWDVAETYARRANAQRDHWKEARELLGLTLLNQGRFADAAQELTHAVEFGSETAATYGNLAYCEARLGRFVDARAHMQAAQRADPSYDARPVLALLGGR